MVPVVIVFIILFSIFMFLGLYVLIINPKKRVNIIFFCISLCISEMAIGCVIMQQVNSHATAHWWYRFGTYINIVEIFLCLVFAVEISDVVKRKFLLYSLVGMAAILLIVKVMSTETLVEFVVRNGIRYITHITTQDGLILYSGYLIAVMFIYMTVLLVWRKRTNSGKDKRLAAILILSFCGTLMIFLVYLILLFHVLKIFKMQIAADITFYFIPWFLGIFYCVVRFRFLSLTPELVSRDLIESIDESIILLDRNKKVTFNNGRIGRMGEEVPGGTSGIEGIIVEFQDIEKEIDHLLDGDDESFICRCTYWEGKDTLVPVHAKFSRVKDRYGDVLGIMVVAKRIKEVRQLKLIYRITSREMEIIQHLLPGSTYDEIADGLNITRNTIKRHIANIYRKMNVGNRVELVNLLREYDLIPADTTTRTVLLPSDFSD